MASEQQTSDWYVVLTQPGRELTTVWRLHRMDLELYVPSVIRLVKSGGWRGKVAKVRTPQPRMMFPGYGFLRCDSVASEKQVKDCDGVMGLLPEVKAGERRAARLPHQAIMAIRAKQLEQHRLVLDSKGVRESTWKVGDMVRVDEGSVYSGFVAKVESVNTQGRIEIMLGMIRYSLPSDMVVAA